MDEWREYFVQKGGLRKSVTSGRSSSVVGTARASCAREEIGFSSGGSRASAGTGKGVR